MPTDAEMLEVTTQIQSRIGSAYRRTGTVVIETIEGDLSWDDLSEAERETILQSSVTWKGFTPEQEQGVIGNVLSGDTPERWMLELRLEDLIARTGRPFITTEEWRELLEFDAAPSRDAFSPEKTAGFLVDKGSPEAVLEREAEIQRQGLRDGWEGITSGRESENSLERIAERDSREDLIAEAYQLTLERGYADFRDQYFNDPDAIREWPDPQERERFLRVSWDGHGSFEEFRDSLADQDVAQIEGYRDELVARFPDDLFSEAEPGFAREIDRRPDAKALVAEIRADEQADRVERYGQAAAATYDERMAQAYRLREMESGSQAPEPEPGNSRELDRLMAEVEALWRGPAAHVRDDRKYYLTVDQTGHNEGFAICGPDHRQMAYVEYGGPVSEDEAEEDARSIVDALNAKGEKASVEERRTDTEAAKLRDPVDDYDRLLLQSATRAANDNTRERGGPQR